MKAPGNFTSNHHDAAESVFVERALTYVETENYNTLFPPLEGRKYVPTVTAPVGAKFTEYRQYTRAGMARIVTERGQDAPTTNLFMKPYTRQFYRLGVSYEYTLDELLAAQFSASNGGGALNIDMEKATAAREAIERGLDAVFGIGSATDADIPGLSGGIGGDVGLLGLLNQTNASTYTVATGAAGSTSWTLKTPDEKVADITGMIAAQESTTYKVFSGDTILMPISTFRTAAGQRMGDGSDETVISFLRKIHPGITIDSWQYCEGAGTNGTNRIVLFKRDPRFVRHMISEDFRQMPAQYDGSTFKVLCLAKTAGVLCPYPLSIMYADSI